MSCVARSLTTPTSWTRAGNGPLRIVETVNSRPIWPSSSRRRSSCSAGLNRSTCPTQPRTPARGTDLDDLARAASLGRRERLLDQHRHARRGELLGDRDMETRSGRRRSRSRAGRGRGAPSPCRTRARARAPIDSGPRRDRPRRRTRRDRSSAAAERGGARSCRGRSPRRAAFQVGRKVPSGATG